MANQGYGQSRRPTGTGGQIQLPLLIQNYRSETFGLLRLVRGEIESLRADLLVNGAILLRGFSVPSIEEFAEFATMFSGRGLLDYTAGASPRTRLGGGVYTSTEYSPDITIPLHNELSYTFAWPEYLFFFCVTPARGGGETPLGNSRSILERIDADVVARFESRGIRYDRVLDGSAASEFSWQAAFETEERFFVEEYCRAGGVSFGWNADGSLSLSEVRPAMAHHPKTGEKVWFNQADGFHPSIRGREFYRKYVSDRTKEKLRLNAFFGDGGEIDVADLDHIRQVIRSEMVLTSWQAGDILVVDNMLACHGRMPYTGERKILLAMA